MFWRSGNGKLGVLAYREWQEKCFGVGGMGIKVAKFTPGVGVGGVWGFPPFEEATFTPGAGVGVFGGSPHLKRLQTIERGLGMQWPVHCTYT